MIQNIIREINIYRSIRGMEPDLMLIPVGFFETLKADLTEGGRMKKEYFERPDQLRSLFGMSVIWIEEPLTRFSVLKLHERDLKNG